MDLGALKGKLAELHYGILDRMKQAMPEAYAHIRESAMHPGSGQVPARVREISVVKIRGKDAFRITIEGANYFSSDKALVRLGKERDGLKRRLERAAAMKSAKLD